ncbi:MAG: HipA domain-containing protein [Oricola sp.]
MMSIDVFLDAFGQSRHVGTLRRHPGSGRERITYEHDLDWLQSPEAFQFDPTLPLRRGALHPRAGREMFGTLGDSAPDTWGRRLMDRRERRLAEREGRRPRALHEADYLLGVSDETRLGALRFRINGIFQSPQPGGVPSTLALGDLLNASRRIESGEETDEDLVLIFAPGSSLGGARPKASVLDQHGSLSIAKFPKDSDHHSLERWEAIALDMAAAAGLRVADHELVEAAGRTVFLSRRFDRLRLPGGNEAQRVPFMSAMAMTEHADGDRNCSYLELVEAIGAHGASPAEDRAELFRRIAFTILVSNTDDHFRNHGFLWTGRKGWTLSPLYDVNPVPDSPRILSTNIDFDEATASLGLLRANAEYFLPLAEGDRIIRECADVTGRWREFARRRGAPDREIRLMETAFEHEELKAAKE